MSIASALDLLGFAGIREQDAQQVRAAIQRGDNFQGYIPSEALGFIVRNYRALAQLQALEPAWLDCYVHSSHFNNYRIETIKAIFDACDRRRLRGLTQTSDAHLRRPRDAVSRVRRARSHLGYVMDLLSR